MFVLDFISIFLFNRNVIFYITYSSDSVKHTPEIMLDHVAFCRPQFWKWKNIVHDSMVCFGTRELKKFSYDAIIRNLGT